MFTKRWSWIVVGVVVLILALAACTPQTEQVEVTRVVSEQVEVPVEVTRVVTEVQTEVVTEVVTEEMAALGTEERPIKVLFVPSVEADAIISGGEIMAQALQDATGMVFEVEVPTSYAATIEEMCASPDDSIGFIPAQGYVLANERCGVTVGAAAVRFGLPWYAAQYLVPFESEAQSLEDLAGLTWAIPDFGSTSGYLYPAAEFAALGIEPGEIVEAGSHNNAALALYNGEVDFATTFFSPPLLPTELGRSWQYGIDDPEIWREAGEPPVRTEEGRTFVAGGPDEGGYRILDARSAVTDTAPDIFEKTRILALTNKIPNDTLSFGPDFPLGVATDIVAALEEWVSEDNPDCMQSICSEEFYNWTGIAPANDSDYDPVRDAMTYMGITEEDILGG